MDATEFWKTVEDNDLPTAKSLLRIEPELANRDFRLEEERDPHTDGYPLVRACELGHHEMAALLLDHGADVNARSPYAQADQREFGMPLMHAVWNRDWPMANMLLDHGADTSAYPWCNDPMITVVYDLACEAGAPVEIVRRGFSNYLGEVDPTPVAKDATEPVRFFDRLLDHGAQPTLSSIVRQEYLALIHELLRLCPKHPGPSLDCPKGSVFHARRAHRDCRTLHPLWFR